MNPAALQAAAKGDLENFLVAASPGGIERQEAAGQRALVSNFRQLPKDMGSGGQEVAEALGFTFGKDVDELFVAVTAPEGWRMEATGHSMHSQIFDAAGRERGRVFYKAAFYDRRADGFWLTRYTVETDYPEADNYDLTRKIAKDRATGEVLWAGEALQYPEGPYSAAHREHHEKQDAQTADAISFLDERFPDWRDVTAYWNSSAKPAAVESLRDESKHNPASGG